MDSGSIAGFSDWYSWPEPAVEKAPLSPGVYVFRLKGSKFGRLKGESDLVYVGTTKKGKSGLKGRLQSHAGRKDERNWIRRVRVEVGDLEVAWLKLETHPAARLRESELLAQYSRDHIELPPGNRQQSEKSFQDVLHQLPKLPREELHKLSLRLAGLQEKSAKSAT